MSPSSRDWRLFAEDILDACRKIHRFIEGMTFETFITDDIAEVEAAIRRVLSSSP